MKNLKTLIVILLLVVLAAPWVPPRVLSSQAASPDVEASPADSLNLEYLGHTGGEINLVTLQGNYAYINEGASLTILDISLPGSVSFVGNSSLLPDFIGGIAISGGYAYVANRNSGFRVLDVSDPTQPVEVGHFDTLEPLSDVALAENYAYVVGWQDITSGGLRVFDVSDPGNPVQVSFLEIEWAEKVVLYGGHAYVVCSMVGDVYVVDVSDPTNPVKVGSYNPSAGSTSIAVLGDNAYLATFGGGLRILDVSDPTNPTEIGSLTSTGSAVDIAVQGDYAYLSEVNSPMGVRIVDVSDPTNPTEAGYHTTPAWAFGVVVTGDFAYVAISTSGLSVVDVSNPGSTTETDSYDVPDTLDKVTTVDDHAYLMNQTGVPIVDVSDPTHPFEVGIFDTTDEVWDVAVQGNYAYVGIDGVSPGMHVIDVSDPTNPYEVGYLQTTYGPFGVAVAGDFAYLTRGDLRVVDISDPTSPTEVGYLDGVGGTDVSVSGNFAYLARYPFYGIRVVDISNPTQPIDVGDLGAYSYYAPVIVGDYAYVAFGDTGLTVVDVANPISPTVVGTSDTPGYAESLDVSGDYAYVADGASGLRMIDISDPTNPVEVGYYDTPGSAAGVSASTNLIYVIEQWNGSGLIILRNSLIPITTTLSILSDDPDPSLVSQPITVTFGVTASLGIPTGVVTVTVSEGGETCSGELMDGQGSCQMVLSTAGTHTLTATYAGEGSFLPSSTSEQHTVEVRQIHLPLLLQNQFLCSDFFDDFSDPDSGWYTGEESDGRVEYLNGEYSVLVKSENYYWLLDTPACGQVNYSVEVDARWSGNSGASYGLIFGIQGDFEQFYSFEVNSDNQEYALYRYGPGGWTEIVPSTSGLAMINPGTQTNHLKVTRNGNAITLEINGTNITGTLLDDTITGASGSGLIVSSYSDLEDAEARFDNYSVTGLGSTASAATASFASNPDGAQAQISTYRQSLKARSWR